MTPVTLIHSILCLSVIVCSAQTPSKVIEWQVRPVGSDDQQWTGGIQPFRKLDKVSIESLTVGTPITIGEAFTADDDWLKHLVIRVRNTSGQKLESIQVTLVLPQIGSGSPDVIYCYGCGAAERAKGIAPGEAVDLIMPGGGFYDFVKSRAAEKGGISQINKAEIRFMLVTLPEGPKWVSGCIKTTDARSACPLNREE